VYILDQVRALENEMLLRIQQQGLDFKPKILIVSAFMLVLGPLLQLYHFDSC
jgi:flagellar biosynthesis protein FliQ